MTTEQQVLLLADIHANELALRQVMRNFRQHYGSQPHPRWFLGDLFGRGPAPAWTWRRLREYQPAAMVIGNHDWGLLGRNQAFEASGRWEGRYGQDDWQVITRHQQRLIQLGLLTLNSQGRAISGEVYDFLTPLPVISCPLPGLYLVHGGLGEARQEQWDIRTLLDELVWGYVRSEQDVHYTLEGLRWLATESNQHLAEHDPEIQAVPGPLAQPQLVIVGHWHRRILYRSDRAGWLNSIVPGDCYQLDISPERPALLSPGSVGFSSETQDRDASYAVLTLTNGRATAITFHKVPFDRAAVRQDMVAKGYPLAVIRRLCLAGECQDL